MFRNIKRINIKAYANMGKCESMFLVVLMDATIGLVFLSIYFIADTLITKKKLKRNQLLWDEYSKNMTFDEKIDCFSNWLEYNKEKHGDNFYYIPKM